MIVEAFLNVIKMILYGIIALMPKIPTLEYTNLDGVFKALSMLDLIVNVRVLGVCISILFVFSHIELVWGIIMWVVRKLPFVN